MEVIVQLSRSGELKTHTTIFEVEIRVGVKKNECGWGLTCYVLQLSDKPIFTIFSQKVQLAFMKFHVITSCFTSFAASFYIEKILKQVAHFRSETILAEVMFFEI